MTLTLLPDIGDLLRLQPQYNAATLVEIARQYGAREVLWLSSNDPEHPARDAFGAAGLAVVDATPDWQWADVEAAKLQDFLGQYPQGRERLRAAASLDGPLRARLLAPLTPANIVSSDLLAVVRQYHDGVRDLLGEGPGTMHRADRLDRLAARLSEADGIALVSLDDLPDLLDRAPGARLPDLDRFVPGESSRLRALADRAYRLEESDDLEALVRALTTESGDAITPRAELQFAAANLYLAVGDLPSARELLEQSAHALTDHPRSLAGLVLARLAQVRDAQGERDLARRAYSAVLALSFAPEVALVTAREGLQTPFVLDLGD